MAKRTSKRAVKKYVKKGGRRSARRTRTMTRKTHTRKIHRKQQGGKYSTTHDYRSGEFNKAADQLLMAHNPSTYEQALSVANTRVPGVNTVHKGGRRYARRHHSFNRRMRGGMTQQNANCPTWHGAGGPCVPQPVSYNGPYGAIPIHQTAGIYSKQV